MQDPTTSNTDGAQMSRNDNAQQSSSMVTTQSATDANAEISRTLSSVKLAQNDSVPSLSTLHTFSTHTLNSGTSFGSLDDLMDDHQPSRAAPLVNPGGVDSSTTAAGPSSATYGISREPRVSPLDPSNTSSSTSRLPTPVLARIFAIAATKCYDTRIHIPRVSRQFHHIAIHNCPEMWDTFELLTGNLGALCSRRQVEYVLQRSANVDLHVGLGIASSRLGSWDPSESNVAQDEDPEWPSTLHRNATHLVNLVASFMHRVVTLVIDVHDTQLEPDLDRALQSLFDDQQAVKLRRLTMLGTYQLDRIVRSVQPPPPTPSLSHLRHLWIAYASNFRIAAPMPQITTLVISMVPEESAPNPSSLEQTLANFPNLTYLEILGTAPTPFTLTPTPDTRDDSIRPKLILSDLRHLVLERLSLTSSFLSTLLVPRIQHLEIREFELGFDPRDVRYDTTLLGRSPTTRREEGEPNGGGGGGRQLAPLPFGRFLSNNSKSGTLRSLALERLPDMVVRMCVEFVRIVGDPLESEGECRGLENLVIADSKWPDWEPLFNPNANSNPNGATAPLPLPNLRNLEVQIEHYPGLRAVGGVNPRPEVSLERQEWMDGLMALAEWRVSTRAVVEMLRQWHTSVPAWLVHTLPSHPPDANADTNANLDDGRPDEEQKDPRTLDGISLATGYVDTYPFLHAAWLALQREHDEREQTPRSE